MSDEEVLNREPKVQRIRESLADYSICPTQPESLFLEKGDYWIIRHQGQTAFLKSTRGLNCLAALLRTPGREFHVTELVATSKTASAPAAAALRHVTGGLYGGVPMLDAQAKAEYKRRIEELRNDLEQATRLKDSYRAPEPEAR
jgi:non-specific serine/threonine protein kinase